INIYTNIEKTDQLISHKNIRVIHLPIKRHVNLFRDIECFLKLIFLILKNKPDLIITLTPKGGLLGILTSFLLNVKIRIHYYTGQVWVTRKGFIKELLKQIDKIIFKMSTDCLTDSNLQKEFLEDERVVKKDFLKVLANGSICGVDTSRFAPNLENREIIRKQLGISPDTILLLFLGRLNKDKGILDLADVVNDIIEKDKRNISLLVVGPDEENIKSKIKILCKNCINKIHFIEFTNEPEKYMSAADIFCLPSYREGFGMAALEAGACALPVITSRIYGLIDAVKEDYTGLFHEVKNKKQIKKCIITLVENKRLRETLGKQGRERVLKNFKQEYVTGEFVKFINEKININKYVSIISSNQLSVELFLNNQIKLLSKNNQINIFTNILFNDFTKNINKNYSNIKFYHINIRRRVDIFWDIYSFVSLVFLLLVKKTDIVFTITPKGGFLGIFSSFVVRIKKRIHWYGGQVWYSREGLVKKILKSIDKLISILSTDVLTECNSQKEFLEDERVVKKDFLKVLANGSICGVDTSRFAPNLENREIIRKQLGISPDTILLLFLGRLNKDKGILDLADVVNDIIEKDKRNISLLVVGPDEENIKSKIKILCKNCINKIHFIEFTNEPEKYMSAADIFCLPSYREGFGMAALEAGACALPVITSRIYGLIDAVKEDYTGLFHEVKNKKQIKKCIITLVENKRLRETLGKQGRERVLKNFKQEYVTGEFVKFIQNL
ncbi:glycosyltransferase, partial [Candidatus Pelagibacter sp.]|nr:glycosyltransferase [Candidatus Pelagibacter sp.]